ncbi:laccase-like [Dendronephthya gigantea]|uniref:laccase-like n=1 Tax=Dendronephthya gigantea TaxID=151771 RepID=UPI00106999D1|nr:laccase-like [Dendronephthya gigantea]
MKQHQTSIHWHGMHQRNVPWMDGVADVTQYGIQPNGGKFRYILRAHPSGTHWYHSHVGKQRDEGIFGALIVKEKRETLKKLEPLLKVKKFEDFPERYTLSVTEHERVGRHERGCLPDGSAPPEIKDEHVSSFQINGVKLQKRVRDDEQVPYYTVEKGKNYRFRVIGAIEFTVFRISIDGHKLHVVSTDSYLTEPFETDAVHVHVGERYDFIVKTRTDVEAGAVFPIRIESVEVYCNNHSQPLGVGVAYLRYFAPVKREPCKKNCVALNCPFGHYPVVTGFPPSYNCFTVYEALSLLVPTPREELPDDTYPPPVVEDFFNFKFYKSNPTVNNVKYVFPKVPFAMSFGSVPGECKYGKEAEKRCDKAGCPHAVYVKKRGSSMSIRFVLSDLPEKIRDEHVANLVTHPIHLHGHSFWVTKIAYPSYYLNGTIKAVNDDIDVPSCGHGHWKNNIQPHGLRVDQTTIRKDVIIVPAGGYVVIEFLATNPGWWFMHCHIDPHLLRGMAIAVGEDVHCQNPPPRGLNQTNIPEFCWTVNDFKEKEKYRCDQQKEMSIQDPIVSDEERFFPNEPGEEFDVKNEMDKGESPGENYKEEWLNPRMSLSQHMKKMQ